MRRVVRPGFAVLLAAFVFAACAAFVGASPAQAAAPANPFFERLRAARSAYAAGDLAAAKAGFEAVDSVAVGLPSAIWSLAQIAAREGNAKDAFRYLQNYSAMGLTRSVDRDTTFAWLKSDPQYAPTVRNLLANAEPRSGAGVVARLNDAGLLAEDLAYDGRTRTFYVSSIHRRKVLAVNVDGTVQDFVAPAQGGVWGVYGLALDPARRRLWGSMAAVPTMENYDPADSGRTALICWDLRDGKELLRAELPRDGGHHVLGDITLAPDGAVYATESVGGGLYRLRRGAKALETVAPSGTFGSPQMPVVMEKGRALFVADYPRGIVSIDLRTGAVAGLQKSRSLAASGIDGLYAAPGGLVAIQNGTRPIRILRLETIDGSWNALGQWTVLEQDSPELGEPNHGTVVGNEFYFLGNSGWDRVNAREELETPEDAKPPVILRLLLPATSAR